MRITLGVEEELQTIDATTTNLVPYEGRLSKLDISEWGGATTEIHRCAVEIQTKVCETPDEVVNDLSFLRSTIIKEASHFNHRMMAAGVHPTADWTRQELYDDANHYPHYAHLLDEYGDISRSALSFGLHVHLGLPDSEARVPVMNALRKRLPEIMALSASSPFYESRDTGLQSWRHSILGRYPRMGVPGVWKDENAYFDHLSLLHRTGCLEKDRGLWEDLRIHHHYRTLEVRIADALPCLRRVWLISALLQCEVFVLIEEWRSGQLNPDDFWSTACIDENKWRARRYGMSASMVNWTTEEVLPMSRVMEDWLVRLKPAADALGYFSRLEKEIAASIQEKSWGERIRHWKDLGLSWEALIHRLCDETQISHDTLGKECL